MSSTIDSVKLASFTSPQQDVEVLKDFLEQARAIGLWVSDEQEKSFGVALLALEQKEDYRNNEIALNDIINRYQKRELNLREWLEKEIAFCNEQICDKQLEEVSKLHFASYKMGLTCALEFVSKEVLGELK